MLVLPGKKEYSLRQSLRISIRNLWKDCLNFCLSKLGSVVSPQRERERILECPVSWLLQLKFGAVASWHIVGTLHPSAIFNYCNCVYLLTFSFSSHNNFITIEYKLSGFKLCVIHKHCSYICKTISFLVKPLYCTFFFYNRWTP